jgi:hypothetical protein
VGPGHHISRPRWASMAQGHVGLILGRPCPQARPTRRPTIIGGGAGAPKTGGTWGKDAAAHPKHGAWLGNRREGQVAMNDGGELWPSAGNKQMAAAIPGTPCRVPWKEGRGRDGEPPGHLGLARGHGGHG